MLAAINTLAEKGAKDVSVTAARSADMAHARFVGGLPSVHAVDLPDNVDIMCVEEAASGDIIVSVVHNA